MSCYRGFREAGLISMDLALPYQSSSTMSMHGQFLSSSLNRDEGLDDNA